MAVTVQADNKRRILDLLALIDSGDIAGALDFYHPGYVDHDASEARRGIDAPRESLRRAFELFAAAFSGTRHDLHDLVAEGDRVAARIFVEARHTGEIWGFPPSGRVLRNDSIVIYRFAGGRIRERWCRERRSTRSLLEEASGPRAAPPR